MPPDTYDLRALGATATIQTGPARPTVIEVAYEGTAPPLALFGALEMVGVAGLVPQTPPSSAIDWGAGGSTPTIRPFPAVATTVLDERDPDRERTLDAVRLILERQCSTASTTGQQPADLGAPRPSPPTGSVGATAEATPRPGSLAGTAPGGHPSTSRGVVVVVDHASAADVRTLLERHGQLEDESSTTWTAEVAYRGQRSETHHRAIRLRGTVDVADEDALLADLSRHRLRSLELT